MLKSTAIIDNAQKFCFYDSIKNMHFIIFIVFHFIWMIRLCS